MKKRGVVLCLVIAILFSAIFINGCGQLTDEQIRVDPVKAMESCSKAPDQNKDDCYLGIARALKDNVEVASQACFAISEGTDPDRSQQMGCFMELVNAQNDSDIKASICKKINDSDWRKGCVEEIIAKETDPKKAVEICKIITDDKNFVEHCYSEISSAQNISSEVKILMCESKSGSDKDNCYRDLSRDYLLTNISKSLEICNKISDTNFKDGCLNEFMGSPDLVRANPDMAVKFCDLMSILSKSRCYNDLARTLSGSDPKKAVEVCKKLGDDVQVSDCYGGVWFFSNSLVIDNYEFTIWMCNSLTLKKDDCLNRMVSVFIDLDRNKAEAICKLMSSASSSQCLQQVGRR
jgi:hypothetical protein